MTYKLLQQLAGISAVSTDEQPLMVVIEELVEKFKLSYKIDHVGNLVVGETTAPVLVSAHVDEVGAVITKIENDGICRLGPVGLIEPKMLAGERLVFTTVSGELSGVVIYNLALDVDCIKNWNDLQIDMGFESKESAEKAGITVGMLGTYPRSWSETSEKILASALDNRVGVFLACQLVKTQAELIKSGKLALAFTCSEESDYAGIKVMAANMHVPHTIILDVVPHSFIAPHSDITLDGGPIIVYKMGNHLLQTGWKKYFQKIDHQKYFYQPEHHFVLEPEVYQSYGHGRALNYLVPVTNYHHSCYGVSKKSLKIADFSLNKLVLELISN